MSSDAKIYALHAPMRSMQSMNPVHALHAPPCKAWTGFNNNTFNNLCELIETRNRCVGENPVCAKVQCCGNY